MVKYHSMTAQVSGKMNLVRAHCKVMEMLLCEGATRLMDR
jgi:hypothetical protein